MVSTPIILRGFITRAALVKAGYIPLPSNNWNYHPRGAVMKWISQILEWSGEKGCSCVSLSALTLLSSCQFPPMCLSMVGEWRCHRGQQLGGITFLIERSHGEGMEPGRIPDPPA